MLADRTEANDLALVEPERVAALAVLWNDWAARTGVVAWDEIRERRRAAREADEGA